MENIFLLTGGAGFIGSNMAHHLVENDHKVRIFDNFSTGRRENLQALEDHVEIAEGDLRDAAAVRDAVRDVTHVLHTAALPSVERSVSDPASTHDVNITGTLNVLMAARDEGVKRVVFSSSSSVYGNSEELPKKESMMPKPLSPYALSKLAGEHYCRIFYELYGLETFSLRYFNVFGPRQDPSSQYAAVIPRFIDLLAHEKPPRIDGDGEQTRDFTYVDDVVRANILCCSAPAGGAGGVYNVAWGNRISINELAATLATVMNKTLEPIHGEPRAGDVRDSQADASRAKDYLGWAPKISFEEGLRRTVQYLV